MAARRGQDGRAALVLTVALATAQRPLTEEALLAELCAGKVLVVGEGLREEADRLLASPLLADVRLHVNARLASSAWELY